MSYLTHELGFSVQDAGLLMSAFGVGALGGTFVRGKVTDRIGGKPVIFFSLLLGGLFFILLQFAEDFASFYALMLATAFFGEAYRPVLTTLVGE